MGTRMAFFQAEEQALDAEVSVNNAKAELMELVRKHGDLFVDEIWESRLDEVLDNDEMQELEIMDTPSCDPLCSPAVEYLIKSIYEDLEREDPYCDAAENQLDT